jgi:secretion/DNA translocation related TadE-like protein
MTLSTEEGSVTVLAAAVIAVLLVCTMGVADVARVLVERTRAQTAADAASLAAAQDLALDDGDPSADAAAFAAHNGAVLVACACASGSFEAIVTVSRSFDGLLLLPGTHRIDATARAVVDVP